MRNASFYKWRAKYGGMDASLNSQMKAIEDENRRLKRIDLPPVRPSFITRVFGLIDPILNIGPPEGRVSRLRSG
jgi:hypothetical protein